MLTLISVILQERKEILAANSLLSDLTIIYGGQITFYQEYRDITRHLLVVYLVILDVG